MLNSRHLLTIGNPHIEFPDLMAATLETVFDREGNREDLVAW